MTKQVIGYDRNGTPLHVGETCRCKLKVLGEDDIDMGVVVVAQSYLSLVCGEDEIVVMGGYFVMPSIVHKDELKWCYSSRIHPCNEEWWSKFREEIGV